MKCEKILSAVIESHLNRLISAFLKIMLFTCIAGRTTKIQYDLNIFPAILDTYLWYSINIAKIVSSLNLSLI